MSQEKNCTSHELSGLFIGKSACIHCGLDANWTDSIITNEMLSCDMNWDSFEHAGSVEVDKMLLRFTLLPLLDPYPFFIWMSKWSIGCWI